MKQQEDSKVTPVISSCTIVHIPIHVTCMFQCAWQFEKPAPEKAHAKAKMIAGVFMTKGHRAKDVQRHAGFSGFSG